jgi:hypothetical protein
MAANGSLRPHIQAEEISRVNAGGRLLGLFIARVGRNTGHTMTCPTICRAAFRQHDVLRATPPIGKLVTDERQTTRAAACLDCRARNSWGLVEQGRLPKPKIN